MTPEMLAALQEIGLRLVWLLVVVILDLLLGVTISLKQKIFKWDRLADFLGDYGPKILGWLALEALGFLPADLRAIAGIGNALGWGAYGILMLAAAASVLGHVQALGILPGKIPGVPPTDKSGG